MLHDDRAIEGDGEDQDRLDRIPFAKRIALALKALPLDTSIVVSVEGTWGCGKTSILNLIQAQFSTWADADQPIIVNFSPWMIGRVDQLALAFFVQLGATISIRDNVGDGENAAKQLLAYSRIFDALRLIPGTEPWATIVKKTVEAVGGAVEKVSDLKQLDLGARRNAVIGALKALKRRIVVFVDDLDRLPPDEVMEMVRLIKSVADFPRVSYVVAFDSKYVESALSNEGIPEASSYLDKIVQVRLHVPEADSDRLVTLIEEDYAAFPATAKTALPDAEQRIQDLLYHGLRDLLETPRDIKRLFNRLYFVEPACRGEVSLGDLLALEAIALKAPDLYHHIRDVPEAYIPVSTLSNPFGIGERDQLHEHLAAERKSRLDSLAPHKGRAVRRMLQVLFPQTSGADWMLKSNAKALGLIQDPSRLAIAVSAGLPMNEVALTDAYELIRNPRSRSAILDVVIAKAKLSRLASHLIDLAEEDVTDLENLALALAQALDTEAGTKIERQPNGELARPLSGQLFQFLEEQLDRVDSATAEAVVMALCKCGSCITLATRILAECKKRSEITDSIRPPVWVPSKDWHTCVEIWAKGIPDALLSRRIVGIARPTMVLSYLSKWRPDDAKKLSEQLISTDEGADLLMLSIVDSGTDSRNGRYVQLAPSDLIHLGGYERLLEIANRRLTVTDLPHRLKVVYTAIASGKQVYAVDGTIAQ